ncbi:MAG: AI-2E family transporter [Scytolyngbya sp. HA4215-MV1]|nr:AI-2E family transporter [Scytolyngbya sp. HA4215-MV1]
MALGRWIDLLSLVVSLYVLWQIRAIVLLFFMAIIFAVGLNRVVRQFQKSRLKRSAAIGLTIASFIVVLGLLLTLVTTRIVEQADQLVELIPGAIASVVPPALLALLDSPGKEIEYYQLTFWQFVNIWIKRTVKFSCLNLGKVEGLGVIAR